MCSCDYDGDDWGVTDRDDLPWEDEDGIRHDPNAPGGLTRQQYDDMKAEEADAEPGEYVDGDGFVKFRMGMDDVEVL